MKYCTIYIRNITVVPAIPSAALPVKPKVSYGATGLGVSVNESTSKASADAIIGSGVRKQQRQGQGQGQVAKSPTQVSSSHQEKFIVFHPNTEYLLQSFLNENLNTKSGKYFFYLFFGNRQKVGQHNQR